MTLLVVGLLPAVPVLSAAPGVSEAPFSDPARFQAREQGLPELGGQQDDQALARRLAEMARDIGEASMNSSDDRSLGDQAEIWAFNQLRDTVAGEVSDRGEALLSPLGNATLDLQVDMDGNFSGTGAQLFTPWQDRDDRLTFSQLSVREQDEGLLGNAGLGQRWISERWLLGYNAFVDHRFRDGSNRGSIGAEAWNRALRFSANYYLPLSGWKNAGAGQQQRMARGYDITTQSYLPFWRQLGVSLSYEQYLGDRVDLFNSGNPYHNPSAVKLGVTWTPVPLVTLSASHKEGEGGETQDQFGLKLNYRFGVALEQQLRPDNVDAIRSLRGSRYDSVERRQDPVMAYRQRKTLSVFLATPPWQLAPGETLALKVQIHHAHPIRQVIWQGDTRELSLTPPPDNRDPQGWTIILPAWDGRPGASNSWRLSVTLEDDTGQKVTSNWITLSLTPPVTLDDGDADARFNLMAP
nr:YchO/YchP family invasin [Pantoea sp. 1.19]